MPGSSNDDRNGLVRALVAERGGGVPAHDESHWGHVLGESDIIRFRTVADWLPAPPGRLLDVGAGTGVLTDTAAALGWDAMAVDTDALAMARMSSPHQVASIADLPFGDRSFDVVVTSEVWEHLPVDVFPRAREEVARVAGSTVIVTVPNAESLESASTRCTECGCVYSIHGHVRSIAERDLPTLLPGLTLVRSAQMGPYKLRHRAFEWYVRRRLLGRWPAQPGALCPQCHHTQPGELRTTEQAASGRLGSVARTIAGFPWQRWWLIARYERPGR